MVCRLKQSPSVRGCRGPTDEVREHRVTEHSVRGGMSLHKSHELVVLDTRAAIHVKTDPVLREIDEHQADMRVFRNVSADITLLPQLRVRDGRPIEDFDSYARPEGRSVLPFLSPFPGTSFPDGR